MKICREDNSLSIQAKSYTLSVLDSRSVQIRVHDQLIADLRVVSGITGTGDVDDVSQNLEGPDVQDIGGGIIRLVWTSTSNRWARKTYTFECTSDLVGYRMEVQGEGDIDAVHFFEGKQDPPGDPSRYHFSRLFTSECTMLDRRDHKAWEYACIDATSGQTSEFPQPPFESDHWIFTPPPFVYAWGSVNGVPSSAQKTIWLGVGLAPDPGHYNFHYFQHWPLQNHFKLRLSYDGMTHVDGFWSSPRIIFKPASSEYNAIKEISEYLYSQQLAVRPRRHLADWWSRPILCGWGEQVVTSNRNGGGGAGRFATQEFYDNILLLLAERKLNPGTIVIDDKWQREYGTLEVDHEKWPDMRGWIDAQHAIGRKVLLWLGCWNAEGLPIGECITHGGNLCCADPSNPAYEDRLKSAVRRMLSDEPGCYNADGFKVDWTNSVPAGPGFKRHGGIWGVELLKKLYEIIYVSAKAIKNDALIITHAANPYFADVTDMVRLNDMSAIHRNLADLMGHRQKIALAANSDWLIDCDNSTAPTHDEWLRYTIMQPELGVPSIYFLTGVDGTMEEIPVEDFAKLPDVWRQEWM